MNARPQVRRYARAAAIVTIGAAAALALYSALFGLPNGQRPSAVTTGAERNGPALPTKDHAALVQETWRRLSLTPIAHLDNGEATTKAGFDRLLASASDLTDAMRESFRQRIRAELRTRSGSADEYIAFADADPAYRWIRATDPEWATVDGWWGYAFDRKVPAHDDPRALLRTFLDDLYTKRGGKWTAFGSAPDGARLAVFTVRVPEEVTLRLEQAMAKGGQDQRDLWLRATSARPVTFRVPNRRIEDILRDDGVAQVAVLMMIVETEHGDRFNWSSVLVWDAKAEAWSTESSARKGWSGTMWN